MKGTKKIQGLLPGPGRLFSATISSMSAVMLSVSRLSVVAPTLAFEVSFFHLRFYSQDYIQTSHGHYLCRGHYIIKDLLT